ncbi:hypothetical protein CF336_g5759 [Tilletia laevis]|nr:hypothetical protein CF335_g8571 [Tilletia laevis]KAE8189375.1 hypothetical protein CF336_g5759 [Tilletia laevis]KAE8239975.1 hypothetical protein A4X03_0g8628 [Tilletia caries]
MELRARRSLPWRGRPRTSFSASFGMGATVTEGLGGKGSGAASPDGQLAGAGRNTSDVGVSSASKQAAAFAAETIVPPGSAGGGAGGGSGRGMGSRKTSLGSNKDGHGAPRSAPYSKAPTAADSG